MHGQLELFGVGSLSASRRKVVTRASLSIFGLGYVGAVSAACFSERGHVVIGVDPDPAKVDLINSGRSPIVEAGLDERLADGITTGRLLATSDAQAAVLGSDISFVCVGTPSAPDGSCDTKYLRQVAEQIGRALKEKARYHLIVFRSTVPPGTTRRDLLPIIEEVSGKKVDADFGLCFHPEFLRESTAIQDFYDPPKTVVGASDDRSSNAIARLYKGIDDQVIHTSLESAEMVKYVDNSWHALKVSFANEIGKVCRAAGIDSHDVMDIFVQDTKLNLSSYYLKPGFAFGGSCLPKDVRGINKLAVQLGVQTPVLNSIIASNASQIDHAVALVEETGCDRIGFLGVTFKADTDDLRESPVLQVIEAVLAAEKEVRIYDPNLNLESATRHHLQHSRHDRDSAEGLIGQLPGLVRNSLAEVCDTSDVLVVSHNDPNFRKAVEARRPGQQVVDLVRLFKHQEHWRKMLAAGMNDYLQKPASAAELQQCLQRWTDVPSDTALNLLLVEDDPVHQIVLKAMLCRLGHAVKIVGTGGQAVKAATAMPFHAVLMDVSMPEMDGYEATRQIRSFGDECGSVPIIALTAYAAPEQSSSYAGICW